MSEIKVSQMPEANNINDNDLFMIIQGGYNKKIPKELLGIPTKAHQINVGEDTDYRVNLLKTKNLFDEQFHNGDIIGAAATLRITNTTQYYLKPGTYTFSTNLSNTYDYGVQVQKVGKPPLSNYPAYIYTSDWTQNASTTFTINEAGWLTIGIRKHDNSALNVSDISSFNYMLEEGTTATEYTPFIPNQINVDNEKFSDTINVGATEDNRSRVNVLHSRNLFDKNSAPVLQAYVDNSQVGTSSNARTTYIPCKPNTTYTIQKRNDGTYNRFVVATTTTIPANGVATAQYINNADASSITITTNSTAKYLVVQFYHVNETIYTEQQALDSIMINEGSTALPYEPYVVPSIKVDGDNILKIRNGKGTFTHSSINYGSVFYNVFQNLVIITIQDLQCSSNITSSGDRVKIGTGLPKNADTLANTQFGVITNYNNGSTTYTSRVIVDENGDLYLKYSSLQTSQRYYGTFIYLTTD